MSLKRKRGGGFAMALTMATCALLGATESVAKKETSKTHKKTTPQASNASKVMETVETLLPRLETYLSGLKTLKADFVQMTPGGVLKTGVVWLNRADKKLRLSYEKPAEDVLIIKDGYVSFYDAGTKDTSTHSVEGSPAAFLLRSQIRLRLEKDNKGKEQQDYVVHSLKVEKEEGQPEASWPLMLKLGFPGEEEGVSLTLVFTTEPYLKIVGWRVCDASGVVTPVALSNVEIGVTIDPKLFQGE